MTFGDEIMKRVDKVFELIGKYRKGILTVFVITVVVALGYGYTHPEDLTWMSQPNFIRPGEDTAWAVRIGIIGWIRSSFFFYCRYCFINIPALALGGVVQWVLNRPVD